MSRRPPQSSARVGGLKDRKRVAAMRQIQVVAVRLFDEHGFDHVTVEEIAAQADASPSSVYRYFGTKEGILIQDEYDEHLLSTTLRLLTRHDIYTAAELALRDIGPDHFQKDQDLTSRRGRYFFEVPSVRAALYLRMNDAVMMISEALVASNHSPRYDLLRAHVVVNSVLWGLLAATEDVVMGRSDEPLEVALQRALEAIRPHACPAGPAQDASSDGPA